MRSIRLVAVLAVAATAVFAPVAAATPGGGQHARVRPADNVQGNSGGDLIGDWYAQNMALPASNSPFGGTADKCLDLGRHGRVANPAGGLISAAGMTCAVRQDRPVVVVMTSADCSDVEDPPFFGADEAAQRACAIDWAINLSGVTAIDVSIDGGDVVNIRTSRYFAVSPQTHTVFDATDPVFGAPKGAEANFVAAGWLFAITGMRRGTHTMVATVSVGGEPLAPFIVHFDVFGGND
jgi:hypothetical protein